MNILNQAIIPKGQAFKGSSPQEVPQHVPVSLPNRNLSGMTGDSSQRGALFSVPAVGYKSATQTSTFEGSFSEICNNGIDPWTIYFSRSLVDTDNEHLSHVPKQIDVLVVAVSSAMQLDGEQIELISRKMQKLTGSRNLRLECTIDSSLIAGFVIRYDSDGPQVIDLSVKGQLAVLVARAESSDRRNASHGHC